ncbi:MAG: flavodoxin family protein [Candidatus Thorarchaeota archaeon]|nr:flavodoxin family protein [Candidatus Thorarchaeota archaeon]
MIHILGISGSPRTDGNTTTLIKAALEAAGKEGAKTQLIELGDLGLGVCLHGAECYESGNCVQDDGLNEIAKAMREANGIIFGSPAYYGSVPGLMKNMFDRVGRFVDFRGKVGSAIAVGRRSGMALAVVEMTFFMYVKEMIIPGIPYWPSGFALHPTDILGDTEAMAAAREMGSRVTILARRLADEPLPWTTLPPNGIPRPSFGDDWR